MIVEYIDINLIKEYKFNAKLHPKFQIEQIKESILEFGFNDPIAIDENNVIIEGHGRYKALMELRWKKVPIIRLKHLSEIQKQAYIIAHNKINLNTEFDLDKVKEEMNNILEDIDLDKYGFEDIENELEEDIDSETVINNVKANKVMICPQCKAIHPVKEFKEVLDGENL